MNPNRTAVIVLCLAIPAITAGIVMFVIGLDGSYTQEQKSARLNRPLSPEEFEQKNRQQSVGTDAIFGAYLVFLAFVFVTAFGVGILKLYLLIWVYKDATNRGHSGWGWLVFCVFFPFMGQVIYLCVRPQGRFATCKRCGQKGISYLLSCPHCGCRNEDDIHAPAAWAN